MLLKPLEKPLHHRHRLREDVPGQDVLRHMHHQLSFQSEMRPVQEMACGQARHHGHPSHRKGDVQVLLDE